MADTTFLGIFPALKAVDNGDGTFSIAVTIPGMPPLTGMTAGELLVATSATTAAWQNTGVKLTAPDIQGVVTAAAALTLPAFAMGGALTMGNNRIQGGLVSSSWNLYGSTSAAGSGAVISIRGSDTANSIVISTPDAAKTASIARLVIGGNAGEAVVTWQNSRHSGLKLGAALTLDGKTFDAGAGSARIDTTGSLAGLTIVGSHADHGPQLQLTQDHTTPALNSVVGRAIWFGYDHDAGPALQVYAQLQVIHSNIVDTTEQATMYFYMMNAGAPDNLAMTLSGAGVLAPDHSILFGLSQDSALVANEVSLGGFDIGGARSLAISQENPVVVEAIGASDRTLPVRINGVNYKILLKA